MTHRKAKEAESTKYLYELQSILQLHEGRDIRALHLHQRTGKLSWLSVCNKSQKE